MTLYWIIKHQYAANTHVSKQVSNGEYGLPDPELYTLIYYYADIHILYSFYCLFRSSREILMQGCFPLEKKAMVILWTKKCQTCIIFPSKKGGRSRAAQGSIISLLGSQGCAVGLQTGCHVYSWAYGLVCMRRTSVSVCVWNENICNLIQECNGACVRVCVWRGGGG